eukprot:CAMPEP_0113539066 /NCGR_PEP_ID=MMETSP0015_2-20120614/7716_1 /TAXON_ID=2838 /ORGANISM="Odontella" /LENGTH=126 /DNA_ID=CAMNT_0000438713 /DNA_START=265 /DNA_END=644 /DNA_ORIENTATION=+ /assembly_acc=CAM_ASM_000160
MTVKGDGGNEKGGQSMTGLDPGIPVVTATVVDPDTRFDNEIAVPPSASAAAAVTSNSVPPAYVPASTVEGSKIASSDEEAVDSSHYHHDDHNHDNGVSASESWQESHWFQVPFLPARAGYNCARAD